MKRNSLTAAVLLTLGAIGPCGSLPFAADAGLNKPHIAPVMRLKPINQLGTQYELMIYGDIGESWYGSSVLAADVVQQLNALPPTVAQINVRVNSYGGSVSDGLAIYNALKRMAATKVVTIDGVAMSIASLIAMCGDTIEMPEASLLMIHAPWGAVMGNSADLREYADFLDVYAEAMAGAYVAKSGQTRDQIIGLLTDGKDHTYTAAQAHDLGFCDVLLPSGAADANDEGIDTEGAGDGDDEDVEAFLTGMERFTQNAATAVSAIRAAVRHSSINASAAGALAGTNPAAAAASTTGDSDMLRKFKGRLISMAPHEKNKDLADGGSGGGAPNASAQHDSEVRARALNELKTRNAALEAALKPMMQIKAIAELYTNALSDPDLSVDMVNAKALAIMAAHASPTGQDPGRVEAGADQRDKDQEAMANWILARANARGPSADRVLANADPTNPFRGHSLHALAEHCVRASGINTNRMTRAEIVAEAMRRPVAVAGHSTSDFPNLLANTLNKMLVATYTSTNTTWQLFAKVSDLADFRPNLRLRMGGFSDLLPVNEAGNYQQGTINDASKETIQAARKGRKLVVTREMIVNDDLQAFADAARYLGAAAARSVDKDVFALFALNGGAGPTMGDGYNLFDGANHGNVASTPAAPSVVSFEAARVQMATQSYPTGENTTDFLDLRPNIWLGPVSISGAARVTNNSQYDTTVSNKFQVPNIVNGLFGVLADTPRLAGTAWYALASPDDEPVFEVGFLDGQRTPRIDQEVDFDSDGIKWKVVLEYGVAATGWRGIVKNAGA